MAAKLAFCKDTLRFSCRNSYLISASLFYFIFIYFFPLCLSGTCLQLYHVVSQEHCETCCLLRAGRSLQMGERLFRTGFFTPKQRTDFPLRVVGASCNKGYSTEATPHFSVMFIFSSVMKWNWTSKPL